MSKILVKRTNGTTGLYKYKAKNKAHELRYSGKEWQVKDNTIAASCVVDYKLESLFLHANGDTIILPIRMLEPLAILLSKVRKNV